MWCVLFEIRLLNVCLYVHVVGRILVLENRALCTGSFTMHFGQRWKAQLGQLNVLFYFTLQCCV